MTPDELIITLRAEGERRYHDRHPFHQRMHAGKLSPEELRRWVQNRWYYQTRIPIKDALILSKSEDPAFRRAWRQRIVDHDGDGDDPGGIARWERLAAAVGLLPGQLGIVHVLPGVRFACDAYVELVRDAPLVVAVASSLTEAFAPDLMSKRIAAWETHYPWVDREGLTYFRERIPRARRDGADALDYVADNAVTPQLQAACVAALVRKTEVLWHLLDCVERGATC